jgi:four helix bundle protein
MQDFRKLDVWHKAHALALDVRRVTTGFPRSGYTAQRSQILRAVESIPTNIVEGCFAASQKDFARFLEVSIKSAGEVEYELQLAYDCGVLHYQNWKSLTAHTVEVRRMTIGLRKKVLARLDNREQRD